MKCIFILLFILTELVSYGQAKIGMSPVFSFTPASATTPSSTINYSTTVSFRVYVKNKGNVAFTGSGLVSARRDTTNGIMCDTLNYFGPIQPNDSVSITLTFTPTPGPNAFKSGGNGNTIVVWPMIATGVGINGDSVRPVIWVNDVNSVFEFEKDQFKIYPNPVLHELTIKPINGVTYKSMIIYDVFARKVKELSFKETVNVSDLTAGSYWMIISSEEKSYRVNFIKE